MENQKIILDSIITELRELDIPGLDSDNIFGQIDPNRVWQDEATLEVFLESSKEISDAYDIGVPEYSESLYKFAIHAPTRDQAFDLYTRVLTALDLIFSDLEQVSPPNGDCIFQDWETFPDTDGTAIQNSYWAVFQYKIYHKTED